jgi:hypothetical protein
MAWLIFGHFGVTNGRAEATGRWGRISVNGAVGTVTWLGVRSDVGMTPRLVFMEGGRVTWVVRLVKIGADGEEQRVDVVRTARPGDLAALVDDGRREVGAGGFAKGIRCMAVQQPGCQAAIAACGS